VNRIELTCGKPAFRFLDELERATKETIAKFKALDLHGRVTVNLKPETDSSRDVLEAAEVFSVEPRILPKTVQRFCREILEDHHTLNNARESLHMPTKHLEDESFVPHSHPKHLQELSEIVFGIWKSQKKEIENLNEHLAKEKSEKLVSKVKNNRIFEVIPGTRKELIDTASELLRRNPKLTVILANQIGDIIGMSNKTDMGKEIREICQKVGGSGGGNPSLAQGKVELSKLLKVM